MVVVCLRVVGVVLVVAEVEQGGNLGRLRHSRGFDQHVVEQLLLSEGNDLVDKVALESAAEAAVLHRNHLVALHESRLVNQTLVNVQGGHVVHDDGALEAFLGMLGLQDVFHQGGLSGTKESTEQRHRQQFVIRLCRSHLDILEIFDKTDMTTYDNVQPGLTFSPPLVSMISVLSWLGVWKCLELHVHWSVSLS